MTSTRAFALLDVPSFVDIHTDSAQRQACFPASGDLDRGPVAVMKSLVKMGDRVAILASVLPSLPADPAPSADQVRLEATSALAGHCVLLRCLPCLATKVSAEGGMYWW